MSEDTLRQNLLSHAQTNEVAALQFEVLKRWLPEPAPEEAVALEWPKKVDRHNEWFLGLHLPTSGKRGTHYDPVFYDRTLIGVVFKALDWLKENP